MLSPSMPHLCLIYASSMPHLCLMYASCMPSSPPPKNTDTYGSVWPPLSASASSVRFCEFLIFSVKILWILVRNQHTLSSSPPPYPSSSHPTARPSDFIFYLLLSLTIFHFTFHFPLTSVYYLSLSLFTSHLLHFTYYFPFFTSHLTVYLTVGSQLL